MLKIVADDVDRDDLAGTLDGLVSEGARRMLMAGLEAEVADYIERHTDLVDEAGHRLVVRNGRAAERSLMTGADGRPPGPPVDLEIVITIGKVDEDDTQAGTSMLWQLPSQPQPG